MKQPVFEGACTAIVTPFRGDGIDFETLDRQLDFQIKAGIAAIVCAGTTGENATLEIHEHNRLVDFCVRKLKGKMKIIVGIGGNNTSRCMSKAKDACLAGADGVLMTPPYYNKCSPSGLLRHFFTVADAVDIPLILYNVPSRTSVGISADAYGDLAKHGNINGVKEASGDISLAARISAECGDNLNIWSGNDDNAVAMMAIGAKGLISVLSNIAPQAVVRICSLCLAGRFHEAFGIYRKYAALARALFCEVNPIPVKAAMKILGTDSGELRLPLTEIAEGNMHLLKTLLSSVEL